MNRSIVESTNVPEWKTMAATICVKIPRRATNVSAIQDMSLWPMARLVKTLTNAQPSLELVLNVVSTLKVDILVNVIQTITQENQTARLANAKITLSHLGSSLVTNITSASWTLKPDK